MKRVIAIAGPSGSGKTTVTNELAERLGLRPIDTGAIFRQMAKERGMDVMTFGKFVERHPKIDRELDDRLAKKVAAARNGVILQGRLAAWTCVQHDIPAMKFWVTASAKTRAKRVANREKIAISGAYSDLMERDRDNRERYLKTYGLDLNDLTVYDAVVNTDDLSIRQVANAIIRKLPKVWLTK
jgi:cytidylate kinase